MRMEAGRAGGIKKGRNIFPFGDDIPFGDDVRPYSPQSAGKCTKEKALPQPSPNLFDLGRESRRDG